MNPISDDSLKSFREIWDKAEARIKRTERLNGSLAIPAVNELRYAGYHLINALTSKPDSGDDDSPQESIKKGTLHCRRATYDAVDAESLYYLERAKRFEQEFEDTVIDIPNFDYMAIRARIREARDVMAQARNSYETRDIYYEKMIANCSNLKTAIDSMGDARIELVKKRERQKKDHRKYVLTLAISIAAVVAGLSGWAVFYRGHPVPSASDAIQASPRPSASPKIANQPTENR